MTQSDDPLEASQLDLTSAPDLSVSESAFSPIRDQRSSNSRLGSRVRLYFGCCKVFADLTPPKHVSQGESDVWRAHCPRCGELIEILFE